MGDALLGKLNKASGIDLRSPDWTCDGNLRKRWAILDGKRCLIKAGSPPFQQQPFGEVIAARIAERLGISHIPYTVIWTKASLTACARISSRRTRSSSPPGG